MLYTFRMADSCTEQIPDPTVLTENNQHFQPLCTKVQTGMLRVPVQMQQLNRYYNQTLRFLATACKEQV